MERRNFVKTIAIGGAVMAVTPLSALKLPTVSGTSTVALKAPLVHVRHGLYNPILASELTKPIAGNWVYSFSADVFARDGVKAELGDKNPVSISMFVGDSKQKELLHVVVEHNNCNRLINNDLKSIQLELNEIVSILENDFCEAQIIRSNSQMRQLPIQDGEHFVALISGEAELDNVQLNSQQALLIDKSAAAKLSVVGEAKILVVTRKK
jgi:hypothetical protein